MRADELPEEDSLRELVYNLAEHGHATTGARYIDVGSERFTEFFAHEYLDIMMAKGGSTCRFFEGDSGSGKTHTLRLIEGMALEMGFIVCWIDLNVVTRLFNWDLVIKEMLKRMTIRRDGADVTGMWNLLNYYSEEIPDFGHLKHLPVSHPGFRNAICHALNPSHLDASSSRLLQQYLQGGRTRVSDLKRCGIRDVKDSLSEKNAEKVLTTVLNCLAHLDPTHQDPRGTVLFFDETDNTWEGRNHRKIEASANVFRRLIDSFKVGDVKRSMALFGVLPNFMDDCMENYAALGQRLVTFRTNPDRVPWRYHKVPIWAINPTALSGNARTREDFLNGAIERAVMIIENLDGDVHGAQAEMLTEGTKIIHNGNGENYKRKVVRTLYGIASRRIGG